MNKSKTQLATFPVLLRDEQMAFHAGLLVGNCKQLGRLDRADPGESMDVNKFNSNLRSLHMRFEKESTIFDAFRKRQEAEKRRQKLEDEKKEKEKAAGMRFFKIQYTPA